MRYCWVWLFLVLFPCSAFSADVPEVFAGKVFDAAGAPVAGATVWLTSENWDEPGTPPILARREVAEDGSFRFTDLPAAPERPGSYSVVARADGWAFAWSGRLRQSRRQIRLRLCNEFPLRGRVVGPDGEPVAGVRPRVTFLTHRPGFDPLAIGTFSSAFAPPVAISEMMVTATDDAGRFALRSIPLGVNMHLRIADERFASAFAGPAWRELREGREIEITLERPGTIRGRVLDARDGTPKPGLSVGSWFADTTTTDADGRYELTNLRPGMHHVYLRELPTEFTAKAISDIKVEPGATVDDVNLLIERGVTIRGRVTAQGTGEPIADYGICCNTQQQPRVGMSWPMIESGPDGRYSLQAPEGEAELRALDTPEGWVSAIPHSRTGHLRRMDISARQDPMEVNFEAIRACSISGEVLDPKLQAAAGATVVLHSEALVADYLMETDEQGRFGYSSARPDSEYSLWAYRGDDMTLEAQKVTAGRDGPVTLRLDAGARAAVSGRVIGEDGRPASYALLIPWMDEAPDNCALADDQGRFVVRSIWPGVKGRLKIEAGGYAEQEVEIGPLMPGEQRDVGEVRLAVAGMVVTGRVLRPDGSPEAGIAVDAWRRRGPFSRRFRAVTDLDGRFRIEGLPQEELYLTADRFRGSSSDELVGPDKTDVIITAIPWEELILRRHPLETPLKRDGGRLTGTLRGLYRVRAARFGEIGEECLGLDLETDVKPGEGWQGGMPDVRVTDDRGRRLEPVRGNVEVALRSLELVQLPEADAASLTIEVGRASREYGEPIVFDSLRPMTPMQRGGVAVVLGEMELTDDWISPGRGGVPAEAQLPPYLAAKLYMLAAPSPPGALGTVRVMDAGPELLRRAQILYTPGSMGLGATRGPWTDGRGNAIALMRPARYGPAWVAGIRSGDEVLSCDGVSWKRVVEAARYFRERPVGTEVTLRVRRGEEELDIPVVLGKWEEQFEAEARQALLMLRELAGEGAEDATLRCYELQSVGDHGPIPLPEALCVTLKQRVRQFVAEVSFEGVPVPEEMLRR